MKDWVLGLRQHVPAWAEYLAVFVVGLVIGLLI